MRERCASCASVRRAGVRLFGRSVTWWRNLWRPFTLRNLVSAAVSVWRSFCLGVMCVSASVHWTEQDVKRSSVPRVFSLRRSLLPPQPSLTAALPPSLLLSLRHRCSPSVCAALPPSLLLSL
eukprot:2226735-Pleurochrysis_carterae.AAC.1